MSLYLGLFLVGFLLVHFFKMLRLYLVLMEHKIPIGKFVLLYAKTTLVNLLIPFKIGEIYRFLCISKETKHWQVGILSIIVDRFFDTLALCLILIPCDVYLFNNAKDIATVGNFVLSDITWIFILLLVVIVLGYISILPTYRYLNRYIIREKKSIRSMAALKGLDVIKNWYDFTQNLISGRFALILVSSFMGWIFEIVTIKALAVHLQKAFALTDFKNYIKAIFGIGENILLKPYTSYGVLIMIAITIVALGVVTIGKFKTRQK